MNQLWNNIRKMGLIRRSFQLWSRDWFLKAISLWLAAVLWFFVGGEDSIEKTVRIPVEIINQPRELVISNQYKREIEVSISGPRSVILDMDARKISHQVDLSSASPGTLVVQNDHDHITVPRSVTVQRVQPPSIILSLDKLVKKNLSVVPRTVGTVAAGFEVKAITMNPDFITVTGPATILDHTEELLSRNISLNGLNKSEQLQVPLELSRELVDLIGETSVTAEIEVAPVMLRKTIRNIPIEFNEQGSLIKPDKAAVTALFPQLLLKEVTDPADLLSLRAVPDEEGSDLKVVAEGKGRDNLVIDIISVVPAAVKPVTDSLVQIQEQEVSESDRQKITENRENITAKDIPESELGGILKISADNRKKRYRLE